MPYVSIVFIQSPEYTEEGEPICDAAKFLEGLIGVPELLEYLKQWDYGEETENSLTVSETPPHGTSDTVEEVDGYFLSYNFGLGYVGLRRPCDTLE